MRYTLRQLAVFAEIARSENVSHAARVLNLSQSAASTAMAEFERQFDLQLFDRVGKRLHLNDRGRKLLPLALELLDRAAEFESRLRGDASMGDLRIGATLTIGNYLATLIVAEFLQRHPESRVELHVYNTATVVERIVEHRIDLGMIEGECHSPEVEVEPWIEDELVVFCAPGHRFASAGSLSLAEIANEPWILREQGSGTRETLDHALWRLGAHVNVRFELEHTEAIKRAVEFGLGLGCISRLALRDAFRRGSLVPVAVPELDLRRMFQFVWHSGKYRNEAMRVFLDRCRMLTRGIGRSDEIMMPNVP